jgi:hypothetical protein
MFLKPDMHSLSANNNQVLYSSPTNTVVVETFGVLIQLKLM